MSAARVKDSCHVRAQSWTYQQLAHRHPDRYRELYLEEKCGLPPRSYSKAQSRAKVRLRAEHLDEYRRLYADRLALLRAEIV